MANSRDGNRPMPASFACRIRSSTRAWARCRASRNETWPPVAAGVLVATVAGHRWRLEQRQGGAGVGVLPSDDDPHPGRPGRQVEHAGDLHNVTVLPRLTIGGESGLPRRLGDLGDGVADLVGQGVPDRVLHGPAAFCVLHSDPVEQLVGGAGAVGADQHPPAVG